MLRHIMAGGLPLDIVRQCQNQFAHVSCFDPPQERRQIQVVWSDTVDRRQLAVQDMIDPSKGGTSLKGHQVRHVLDDTHGRAIPPFVSADRTELGLGQVAASLASPNSPRRLLERRNQLGQPVRFFDQQMQRDSLRGTISESGQLLEMLLEFFERWSHAARGVPFWVWGFEFWVGNIPCALKISLSDPVWWLRIAPSIRPPNPQLNV